MQEKVTSKSLVTLGSLLKFEQGIILNFVKNLACKWPCGRQVLFDLFSNPELWYSAAFSYRSFRNGNEKIHKYEVRLILQLNEITSLKFLDIQSKWPKMEPHHDMPSDQLMWRHPVVSRKVFEQPGNNSITWMTYTRNWYV